MTPTPDDKHPASVFQNGSAFVVVTPEEFNDRPQIVKFLRRMEDKYLGFHFVGKFGLV